MIGEVILWSTSLAASLLLVALAAAFSAHRKGRLGRIRTPAFISLLPPFLFGTVTIFLAGLMPAQGAHWKALSYSVSWLILFTAGSAALIAFAVRGRLPGGECERALALSRRGLVAAFGAATLTCLGSLLYMDMQARMEVAKARLEAGLIAGSTAPPRISDRRNAVPVYERALDAINATKHRRMTAKWLHTCHSPLNEVLQPRFDPTIEEAEELLSEQESTLALLRQAAAIPGAYFEADYARPLALRRPVFPEWRRAANLMALSARNNAEKGNVDAAMEDIAAIWGMAAHMSSSPFLESQFMVATLVQKGARTLENCLAAAPGGREQPDVLRLNQPAGLQPAGTAKRAVGARGLQRVRLRDAFVRALRVEEAYHLARVSAGPWPEEGNQSGITVPSPLSLRTAWRLFIFPDELAASRKEIAHEQSLAAMPYYATLRCAALRPSAQGAILAGFARSNRLLRREVAEAEALQRLALLALASRRYRSQHGRYPDQLGSLVPDHIEAIPLDPFDGKPLRMLPPGRGVAADGGVVLYSVSADGRDDGGVDAGGRGPERNTVGDITFCLGETYRVRRLEEIRPRGRMPMED